MARNIAQFVGRKTANTAYEAPQAAAHDPVANSNLGKAAPKIDGRTLKATGRSVQFNTKVRPDWRARFQKRIDAEAERRGENVSRSDFLELMLAQYERGQGDDISPFGLSEVSDKATDLLAAKLNVSKGKAIEVALLSMVKDLKLAKRMK